MIEIPFTGTEPKKSNPTDAGFDIFSSCDFEIAEGERVFVKTDLQTAIPPGYYAQLKSRSGLALKQGIDVKAGVIDSAYRGNYGIILSKSPTKHADYEKVSKFKKGDRIAQFVVHIVPNIKMVHYEKLPETSRGAGGFGSTGV